MISQARSSAEQTAFRRKKVVVVSSYSASLVNFRYQLLKAMIQNGHEVTAIGPEYHVPTVEALAKIGVSFVQVPMARTALNPIADLQTLAVLWTALRKYVPDVILCYTMKPIIYGLIAARFVGVKQRHAMITGLGYVFSEGDKGAHHPLVKQIATHMYRIALRRGGRVFVYNEADEHDVRAGRMVSDATRIVRVPGSGVDFDRFTPSDLPDGPPVFLIMARLLREKGIFEFVRAARCLRLRYPHVRFRILGPFDPSPMAISRKEVDEWVAEGVVEYLGETSDVRPHLAACTVFVLPSYYREGIPRSIQEAMATGRAIITADTPGCRDTIVEGENGFVVPPRDPVKLAAAMERFIDDPLLAARMGRRSVEIAHDRFEVGAVNRLLLRQMALTAGA